MTHPFDAWTHQALLPFAAAALSAGGTRFCAWIGIARTGGIPYPPLPAEGYWGVLQNMGVSDYGTPARITPRDLPLSAHQALILATLAPAFWAGFRSHMHAFDAPLEHSGVLYTLCVQAGEDRIQLHAQHGMGGNSIHPRPFSSHAHWAPARRAVQAARGAH